MMGERRERLEGYNKKKDVWRDKGSVDGDLGSSSGLSHLVVIPHEGGLWQAVCAAVKQHQCSLSLWKQEL